VEHTKNIAPVIWWIRRDLRINHNPTLKAALDERRPVIPAFIIDDRLLSSLETNRQRFLFSGLRELHDQLSKMGCGLVIRHGDPVAELNKLVQETGALKIFAEEDYSPFARKRDGQVAEILNFHLVTGLSVFHPNFVMKADGAPYTVFTPYCKTWKAFPLTIGKHQSFPVLFPPIELPHSMVLPDISPVKGFPAGELEAARRLDEFLDNRVDQYENDRNRMDLDGTSDLSPYFRFGMLSVSKSAGQAREMTDNQGAQVWLNEIIWRDFYQSILYHFPEVQKQAFNPKLRNIAWRNAPMDLQSWKEGQTGYPIVDAAMRQLKVIGWMHNRARMITASFLTKDLLINWQEGENWFMQQLVDGDTASNNGGWQWTAGTGTDAAPYFRIFNPIIQSRKFDPVGMYIRRWVPELQNVPDEWVHEPWKMPELIQLSTSVKIGKSYPSPIVDHAIVKARTLAAYKASQ
jgi:deoxyribodipyrimidine photo-lyase